MSASLFIEVRCEELPASMIAPALEGLATGLLGLLEGIEHGPVRTWSTPRRLAVEVEDVAERRPVVESWVTGPPAERAFDADGAPTRAALGFARGKGADPAELQVIEGPKGKVVALRTRSGGEETRVLVEEALEDLVLGLPFRKSMRWGSSSIHFGRPLHGVGAMLGATPLSAEVAGLPVALISAGHRNAPEPMFSYDSAGRWQAGLRERHVEPDRDARRARVRALLSEAARDNGADDLFDDELVDEVTDLVEWPTLVVGELEAELIELPPRLLVTSMKVHQRVFPLWRDGKLTRRFAVISNTPTALPEVVAAGNARVLRARFHDARFFFESDLGKSLDELGEGLTRMQWIRGLGTVAEKATRVSALARLIAPTFGADPGLAARAGALCKQDLTSEMVYEFPELQGHMGMLYARHHGEDDAVALALEEHYQPAGAADDTAATPTGRAVACADRLDTLVACFGVGITPKGGGDPQGLRRAALGVVRTLVDAGVGADVLEWVDASWQQLTDRAITDESLGGWRDHLVYGKKPRSKDRKDKAHDSKVLAAGDFAARLAAVREALAAFLLARFRAWALAEGASGDQVDAVTDGPIDPFRWARRLHAVRSVAGTTDFPRVLSTCKRVLNITRGQEAPPPQSAALGHEAERRLARAIESVSGEVERAIAVLDYEQALHQALSLEEPVADFFEAVLVEDPNPAIRAARMGLLTQVGSLFSAVADFSQISTR